MFIICIPLKSSHHQLSIDTKFVPKLQIVLEIWTNMYNIYSGNAFLVFNPEPEVKIAEPEVKIAEPEVKITEPEVKIADPEVNCGNDASPQICF